jgi:hypothetical protein
MTLTLPSLVVNIVKNDSSTDKTTVRSSDDDSLSTMSASSDVAVMDMRTDDDGVEMLYTFLEEEIENVGCQSHAFDEIRDEVESYIKQEEIEQEMNDNKQIELLYMVLQEEDQMNGEKANKDTNDANNTDEEYYEPFCIDCLQEPCTWVKYRQAMKTIDYANMKQKGMRTEPNDGGKSRRYPLYRKMAKIQWGSITHRRRHPMCVEEGVRNIAPDPNRNYTGFHAK